MYRIKYVFSLIEEKFIVNEITETSRNLKLGVKDFPQAIWNVVHKIGKKLTREMEDIGGELVQHILIEEEDLRSGVNAPVKSVRFY